MQIPKILLYSVIVIVVLVGSIFGYQFILHSKVSRLTRGIENDLRVVTKEIEKGSTFDGALKDAGISTTTRVALLSSMESVYDISKIRAGNQLALMYASSTDQLQKVVYDISTEQQLNVENKNFDQWDASVDNIPYEIKNETVEGTINDSLYKTFLDNNEDPRLAIALSEIFAWQIDFVLSIRKGDSFKVTFEARYLDGQYKMPGQILAAKFINDGETFYAYHFKGANTPDGYYDEKGFSVAKLFLKFPLQYKYISTYFTNHRIDPITGVPESHRAVDFAANFGTPAVAIGDGVVTFAGWHGPYGLRVDIRYNETYSTTYGHFSSLPRDIKKGVRVKQGQIVGYVGSTGLSTGPHLHYEVRKFGSLVNPLSIKPPESKPINEQDRSDFEKLTGSFSL